MRRINYLVLIVFALMQTVHSQVQNKKEKSIIIGGLAKQGNIKIVSQDMANSINRLIYKGYKRFTESDFNSLKVYLPNYLLIDPKARKGRQIKQEIRKNLKETDLKFDFDNDKSIFFDDLKTVRLQSLKKDKIDRINSVQMDLIFQEYYDEVTQNVFYFGSFFGIPKNSERTIKVFFCIKGEDLKIVNKKRNKENFYSNFNRIASFEKKAQIKKIREWYGKNGLNGYFKEVFPNDSVFIYDVKYTTTALDLGELNLWTKAISNSRLSSLADLLPYKTNYYTPIQIKFNSSVNIYELLHEKNIFIDSVLVYNRIEERYIRPNYMRAQNYNNVDIRVREEIRSIDSSIEEFFKYDSIYFSKKSKDSIVWRTEPLFLTVNYENSYGNPRAKKEIRFDFKVGESKGPWTNESGIMTRKYLENELQVVKSSFGGIYNLNYERKLRFPRNKIDSTYDVRVDKPDFSFSYVDPSFLIGFEIEDRDYIGRRAFVQNNIETISTLDVKERLNKLRQFKQVKNEEQKKKLRNKQFKEKLYAKYGKTYVDEAFKFNVIKGMPQDLLVVALEPWMFVRKTSYNDYSTLYFKSYFDSSKRLSVTIKNEKVFSVSTW